MDKFELIYEMMNGFLDCDALMLPKDNITVTSEFEKGMYCYKRYEEVCFARGRIEKRLGVEDDRDVEIIISNLNEITRYLCGRMYRVGRIIKSD